MKMEARTSEKDGTLYVGVTSAMRLVKTILGEEPDSYGPPALARVHAAEGEGCHRACLNWLAFQHQWLPSFVPPKWDPTVHPHEQGWYNVLANMLQGFQEFCEQYEVEPVGIEQEAFSKAYGLVGHVDLVCWLKWKGRRVLAIIDLKFVAKILETHRLQVRCYNRLDGLRNANLGLLFHGDRGLGTWRLEQVDLTNNLADVMAVSRAAHLWAWGEERKGK